VTRLPRLLAVLAAIALTACGDDAAQPTSTASSGHPAADHSGAAATPSEGAGLDRAFAQAMVPHHESAVAMAEIALRPAQSDFVRDLARAIVSTQRSEIVALERIDARLEKDGVQTGDLGVPHHMQGMDGDPAELRDAKDFDRAFAEMMIPHHEGAIAMAEAQLDKGEDDELKRLSQTIVAAQRREIADMRAFLKNRGKRSAASRGGGGSGSAATGIDTGSRHMQQEEPAVSE
jgi:uncharacterized protein (DUF305 family)